ncbi:hypothetical protein CYMTET_13522 [Cymbomonas tetramitiformis]|uniref:Uncharacterized protein n=1 Tax=Cymbomonas tetramitiformis TaxID=36881 RepID=A0AAE0GI78_9CHLO|nr:hypothetical protein CYMTET_13522 [Cymbomonas tetramitiformis]
MTTGSRSPPARTQPTTFNLWRLKHPRQSVPFAGESLIEVADSSDDDFIIYGEPAKADVGRIGDGYATGKATKSGISNLVIARATATAFGPGKSLNEKPMVLPSEALTIHKAYLRHANEKHVYPEKLTARKLAGLNLEPAEVGERDRWNPPVMFGTKAVHWFQDVRGMKMGPQTEEPLSDGKTEEEADKAGEGGDDEEDDGTEEDAGDEEVAAEGDDADAAAGAAGEGEVVEEEEDAKTASEDDDTEKPMGEDDSKKEEKEGASKEPLRFQKKRKTEPAVKEAQKQAKKPRAS